MRQKTRLAAAAIVVAAALVLPGIGRATSTLVAVDVSGSPTTQPISDSFLGFAFEYSTIPIWAANPVLVQLIRNLDPVGQPSVRIGGISTDRSWWPVPGMARPLGVTYTLTPAWARSARALAEAVDAHLLLGINFEANSPPLARVEADQLLSQVGAPWVGGLTIGNEAPLYTLEPWYRVLGGQVLPWYDKVGQPVFSRPADFGPSAFTQEYARILVALPDVPIAGPDTKDAYWISAFTHFVSPQSRVRILTSHAYGLNNCDNNPAAPQFPSVPHLLSTYASRMLMDGLGRFVALAHRDGASYRIDELGSVTCNGAAGVSDTMAAALWAADGLFAVARDNVDGVNLHSYPNSSNGLFDFTHAPTGWSAAVHPIYYGALLFARAAPPGARLIAVRAAAPPTLRAWATSGPGQVMHVLLINASVATATTAIVRTPAAWSPARAQLERLSAASAYATSGIGIGGRTFGATTTTGLLRPPVPASVARGPGGYELVVPAASAALLTIT